MADIKKKREPKLDLVIEKLIALRISLFFNFIYLLYLYLLLFMGLLDYIFNDSSFKNSHSVPFHSFPQFNSLFNLLIYFYILYIYIYIHSRLILTYWHGIYNILMRVVYKDYFFLSVVEFVLSKDLFIIFRQMIVFEKSLGFKIFSKFIFSIIVL